MDRVHESMHIRPVSSISNISIKFKMFDCFSAQRAMVSFCRVNTGKIFCSLSKGLCWLPEAGSSQVTYCYCYPLQPTIIWHQRHLMAHIEDQPHNNAMASGNFKSTNLQRQSQWQGQLENTSKDTLSLTYSKVQSQDFWQPFDVPIPKSVIFK